MLNATASVVPGPLGAMALPGSAAPDAGAGPAFAQALDQALTQSDAMAGEGAEAAPADRAGALPDPTLDARPGELRPDTAPRPGGARTAAVAGTLIGPRSDAPAEGAPALPDETLPVPRAGADEAVQPAAADDDDTPPPELLAWVCSLPLPPPAAAPARPATTPPAARREATAAVDAAATTPALPAGAEAAAHKDIANATPPAAGAPSQAASARKADVPTAHGRSPAAADSRADAAPGAGGWLQALAAQREAAPAPARPAADQGIVLPPSMGGVAGAAPRLPEATAPVQAELRAELGSKEFAPALGAQLSVLVRDGVEHAQLRLNPAEMGPIDVRISVDGGQAQVDFSAAQAHTRQALQDAVPALAAALRESGLTLTGGGVFEQPRDARGGASAQGERSPQQPSAERFADEALPAPAARLTRARGVLDLYA